jgi:Predicted esterase
LAKPEAYGMCAAFSASCLFLREGMAEMRANGVDPEIYAKYGQQLVTDFTCAFGNDLEWSPEIDLLSLAGKTMEKGSAPQIYAACGEDDFFRGDNARFAGEMRGLGFDYTYEEWEGGHSFFFFDQALKRAVEYFGW